MRIPALVILTIATVLTAAPARAQTYDPAYPVCLHVYGPAIYYECRYTSLPQCNASATPLIASGRLVPVLRDSMPPPTDGFFLYYPSRRQNPAPLEALVDFLRANLKAGGPWEKSAGGSLTPGAKPTAE